MNFLQLGILILQASLIAFIILLLFRLRKQLGIGTLFACLGLFQFLQVFLSETVYVTISNDFFLSPGSSVLFTATLFTVLIIYIKEDASETKKIIYALLIANILLSLYLQVFGLSLKEASQNILNISTKFIDTSSWVLFVGTILLFIDSLLIIVLFEFISKKIKYLFLQIAATMLVVLAFDTICFTLLVFFKSELFTSILISGLISKSFFVVFYSIIFYFYLRYFDLNKSFESIFKIGDVFKPLTYKQKYEDVSKNVKQVEEMYRVLTKHSNDIICLFEIDATLNYISPSVMRILGYEKGTLLGNKVYKYIHSEDYVSLKSLLKNNLFNSTKPYIFRLKHKNGNYIWLELLTSAVYENNQINYYVTTARDVTQRVINKRKIEESVRLLEEKEHSLNEVSKMAKIGYWEYNSTTQKYIWSEYIHHIYGVPKNENLPEIEKILTNFEGESFNKLQLANQALNTYGKPYDLELKLKNLENNSVWVRNVVQPIYNNNNEIVGRRGILQDITDKKLTELKLKENEEKFYNIFQSSPNLIILTRLKDFKITDVNKIAFKATGYTQKELTDIKLNPENIWKSPKERVEYFNKLKQKGYINNYVSEFIKKNGETRIWKTSSQIIKISELEYALSIIEDITEIKRAENILQEQSEFITAMTENQPAGIIACNAEGKLVLFNKKAKEWHGINVLEVQQEKWAEYYGLYHNDGETLLKTEEIPLVKAFNGEKIINSEIVIKAKNQKPRLVVCNATSFSDSDKNVLGAIVVMNDITQEKVIEDNLKRSELETRKALKEVERSEFLLNESGRLAKIGAWELKIPSNEIRWSKQVFAIHGLPVGKVPTLKECVGFYIDGSAEKLSKAIEQSILHKKKFDLILRFKNNLNEKLWVNSIGYPNIDKQGNITSLIGVFQDITEQKENEIKLDAQNVKLIELNKVLNEAQELAHLGNWKYILETGAVTWSKELLNIFEIPESIGMYNFDQQERFYTKESFKLLNKSLNECIQNKTPYKIELDIYTTSGKLKHIISRGKVLLNKNNEVIGCYGTAQDITEQKQIRDNIAKAEKMYRLLTDNSNDLICLHKLDSTFKYISPSIKSILGYEQSDLIETLGFDVIHKDDVAFFRESIKQRVLKKTTNDTFFSRALHKTGQIIWLECSISVIYLNDEIDFILTSSRDVTEKIQANKKIEQYQASLQELTTEITLIEEKQKKEIASNIHDHLSQSLVISNMKIKELRKNPDLELIDNDLDFIHQNITEALKNSREITSELSPPILYQLGFIEALYWLLENIEAKHNINFKVNDTVNEITLDEVTSILLYRSVQELLNNIIKYANATLITVDLYKTNIGVNIIIKDNGVGFNTEKLDKFYKPNDKGSGFGLFTVKERIRNIHGSFKITSQENIGTTVKIFIPLN